MGMTPKDFFDAFVIGNYDDFLENPGSVRRAFNAAISASHLADHYFDFYKINDPTKIPFANKGKFIEFLIQNTNGCFKDIRSIANAYKHLYTLTDPRHAIHSSVSSTGAIERITMDYDSAEFTEVAEEPVKEKVIFTRKDGKQLDFSPTLEAVIHYWGDVMDKELS